MKMSDLRPASQYALQYGVKSIVYGPPGTGKTPIINTAPRPVLLAVEPGLLSMRGSNVPTYPAATVAAIDDFFKWFFGSAESKNFDTVGIDSVSQIAEIYLNHHIERCKDGRKAYGEMSRAVMDHLDNLYFMQSKHVYLIAKEDRVETPSVSMVGGVPVTTSTYKKRPYFPGNDLNIKVPHRYDGIYHIDRISVPGVAGLQVALRTMGTNDVLARDRSGKLAEFEPPNLTNIFNKAMS